MHRLQDLVRLHRMGEQARAVAHQLNISPNTERKYRNALHQENLLEGSPQELPEIDLLRAAIEKHHPRRPNTQELSSIQSWESQLIGYLEKNLQPRAIFDRLRQEDCAFRGSYWAVKRMCARIKRQRGIAAEDIAIRIETAPGEIAQVDFGEIEKLFDPDLGELRRAWVFVMVLSHSRHMFARVVFDQRTETWLRLHAEAFSALGGCVKTVVPDNLKAAVTRAAFGLSGTPSLNRSYREFARHYGLKIDPTPAYSPKKKGKVESCVKYVKRNALQGRAGQNIHDVNTALERWVQEIAGTRIHGTTGKRPLEMFQQAERASLQPLPAGRFESVIWKRATVHDDVHIIFDRAMYSVPWRLARQKVWIRGTESTVAIYTIDDTRVATHRRGPPGSRATVDEHLPEGRRDLRHRDRAYWTARATAMGDEVSKYIAEVFDSDDVLSQLRSVQAIVTHLEKVPLDRAQATCARASFYANYTYPAIKRILRHQLDQEPLPSALIEAPSTGTALRFARNVTELLSTRIEKTP